MGINLESHPSHCNETAEEYRARLDKWLADLASFFGEDAQEAIDCAEQYALQIGPGDIHAPFGGEFGCNSR